MEIWDYNLRHLAAIAQIAELGTMGAAARAINLTQPALTQALARVEGQLALPLFERRHDGMVPTPAADVLVPRIRSALGHVSSPHVTTARLRALLALADSGSYLGASLTTGLAVPTLHRAVKDLSLSLRKTLVERRSNAVVLTEAGQSLARAFRLARVELEAGLAEIEALKGREVRRITVGAMPLSRARILPAAVARFLKRHPNVHIAIAEGARAELVEPLRNGMIDMMIGALRLPLLEPDLAQTALFEDEPIIVARRDHPLAGGAPDLAALARYPWILPGRGAPLRDSWDAMFAQAAVPAPAVPVESGSVMVIRQVLIESDFLALVSPDQAAVELEANWLVSLGTVPRAFHRVIGVTTRASWRPTAVQAEFLADLDAVALAR
ncbi:LysR family transcriptional regulator [Novosphingobium sp. FSW06-99]|uniref:LysR family transcriptional regulator n=1 Tax=Novosphingobium sp. FSW06-99 TaxID=1739113 RepID=UPI00076BC73F|nr:LysR family transcriptional regulator [Novosphingobium sp. FSW06-99]KUR77159.1 LysR family transcriptional regulator [Novosphingobium sp. FSW06-99]